jgi:hypothetical protein
LDMAEIGLRRVGREYRGDRYKTSKGGILDRRHWIGAELAAPTIVELSKYGSERIVLVCCAAAGVDGRRGQVAFVVVDAWPHIRRCTGTGI